MIFLALRVWCVVLAAVPFVLPHNDIHIDCQENSILLKWKVSKDLAENPSRLLLGTCLPTQFFRTADGGGEAVFHYGLSECGIRQRWTEKELSYTTQLTFRPFPKPQPPLVFFSVNCTFERIGATHSFVKPISQALRGQGGLVFHMALLNDDLSGPALSNAYPLGSFINIWASVNQQLHQPLMLHLEECVASSSPTLGPGSRIYPIITNYGCLVASKSNSSRFLPRYWPSSLILQLQAFQFAEEHEVFIHCRLVIWDPEDLNEEKKSCNYNADLGGWELLDAQYQNSLCQCCAFNCQKRVKRGLNSEYHSLVQSSVLGPLIITSPSGSDEGNSTRSIQ